MLRKHNRILKTKTQRRRAQIIFWALFLFISIRGFAEETVNPRRSLSTDEVLEYSIMDLKTRMEKILEANKKLAEEKANLEQTIFSLTKQKSELEDEKMRLMEQSVNLTGFMKLELEESSLAKTKLKDLKTYRDQLKEDQSSLQNQMKKSEDRKSTLTGEIDDLEQKISLYQKQVPKQRFVDNHSRKQKETVAVQIKAKSSVIDRRKDQRSLLEKELARQEENRLELIRQQENLKQQLAMLENPLMKDKKLRYQHDVEAYDQEKAKAILNTNKEIVEMRSYAKRLDQTIVALSQTKDALNSRFKNYIMKMAEWRNLLDEEHDLLLAKEEGAEQFWKAMSESLQESQEKEKITKENPTGKMQELKDAKEDLNLQLSRAEEQEQNLTQRQKDLNQEVAPLEQRLAQMQKMTKAADKDNAAGRQLTQQINDYEKKNLVKERNANVLTSRNEKNQAQLKSLKEQQGALQSQMEVLQKIVSPVNSVEMPKEQESAADLEKQKKEIKELREEVAALRLRHTTLDASLAVVRARYDEQAIEGRNFAEEEDQLKKYLDVLTSENKSLQDKLRTTTVTVNQMKAQKVPSQKKKTQAAPLHNE